MPSFLFCLVFIYKTLFFVSSSQTRIDVNVISSSVEKKNWVFSGETMVLVHHMLHLKGCETAVKPACSWMWASSQKKLRTSRKTFPRRDGRRHFPWTNFQTQDSTTDREMGRDVMADRYYRPNISIIL